MRLPTTHARIYAERCRTAAEFYTSHNPAAAQVLRRVGGALRHSGNVPGHVFTEAKAYLRTAERKIRTDPQP